MGWHGYGTGIFVIDFLGDYMGIKIKWRFGLVLLGLRHAFYTPGVGIKGPMGMACMIGGCGHGMET